MKIITNDLLQRYINRGTILLGEVVGSSEEAIMKTILDRVHPYKITPPREEAKNQRWSTYVKNEYEPTGRKKMVANSKKELFEKLLAHYGINEANAKGNMTFGELFAEWTEYKKAFVNVNNPKKSRSQTTITRYKRDYRKCFADTDFDKTPIMSITSIQIELAFKTAIEKHNLQESYSSNLFGYIKNCFEYAFRMRYISTNEFIYVDKDSVLAFVNVKPPKKDEERILTRKQLKDLYDATLDQEKRHPYYMPNYAIELATQTGMRVGELAALRWCDLQDGYIHIDYSEHRVDYEDHSELVIGEPKNLKHRKFPFNPLIEDIFHRIKNLGIESEFVFARENGERYTAHDISCACNRRGEEAGIENVCIHRIRRTVASELRKIYDIKTVASLLGHLEETDEAYYHYDNSEEVVKIEASNTLYSNVLKFDDLKKNKKRAKAL